MLIRANQKIITKYKMNSLHDSEGAIVCSSTGTINCFQKLAMNILKTGNIPRHVAIIADGNRRFYRKTNIDEFDEKCQGFDRLIDMLQWCMHFGVLYVTVYTLSIENFKRSEREINSIMQVVKRKFLYLSEERGLLSEKKICVRFVGKLSMVPTDVRNVFSKTMKKSENNTGSFFSLAYCYMSQDEIKQVITDIANGVKNADILPEDINENLISKCMYFRELPEPDLLIRTSGEARFSDFLTWQSSSTCLYFVKKLWPEVTCWDLIAAVFYYQRCYNDLQQFKKEFKNDGSLLNDRANRYVSKMNKIAETEKFKIV